MEKVLKYPLRDFPSVGVYMLPEDWLFLSMEVQDNAPVLYVTGDPTKLKVGQEIYCLRTGECVPDDISMHLGTVMLDDDKYVLHYFM